MKMLCPKQTTVVTIVVSFLFFVFNSCAKDSDIFNEVIAEEYVEEDVEEDAATDENLESEEDLELREFSFTTVNDAYIQASESFDLNIMKIRKDLRTSYLMFDLTNFNDDILTAFISFTIDGDPGNGPLILYKGNENNWSEENLSVQNAPLANEVLGDINDSYQVGTRYNVEISSEMIEAGKITVILEQTNGEDLAIASKENTSRQGPTLDITYYAPIESEEFVQNEEEIVEEEDKDELPNDEPVDEVREIQCDYGTSCATTDSSCFDSEYPEMQNFANAGVSGGIPLVLDVVRVVNPGDDLQNAIDFVSNSGGGVIKLNSGTYPISKTLFIKSGVVIRGADKESVILESTVRGYDSNAYSIYFDDATNAGLENLTHFYKVEGCTPNDYDSLNNGPYDRSIYDNDPCGLTDLYVGAVGMSNNTSDSWIDNCNILESGSHAIRVRGNNCTISRCFIDRAYNKGPGGRAYFDIIGDNNLVVNNTVKRIRHFAVHQGARYNVVFNNLFWVDVNFHSEDDGFNLIEKNTITTPSWHGWNIIATGAVEFHKPPGSKNLIYNNTTDHRQTGQNLFGVENTIYTLTGFDSVVPANWSQPKCGTFYAVTIN